MEKQLNQLGIGTRIFIQVLVPLIMVIGLAAVLGFRAYTTANQAASINVIATFTPSISDLVHELQKERGRSAGFIASQGAAAQTNGMQNQRIDTDSILQSFYKAHRGFPYEQFDASFRERIDSAISQLSNLNAKRAEVDDFRLSVGQMAGYYTGTINTLLFAVKGVALTGDEAKVTRQLTAYVSILEAKEQAGIQRAMGNVGYSKGVFEPLILKRFYELGSSESSYVKTFGEFASEPTANFFDETVTGGAVDAVADMREFVVASDGEVGTERYSAQTWFAQTTDRINLLNDVARFSNQEILSTTGQLQSESNTYLLISVAVIAVAFFAVLSFCMIVYRSIANPMHSLEQQMVEISEGNLDVAVPYTDYGSSIGRMASAVEKLKSNSIERLKLEAQAAEVEKERQQNLERRRIEEARLAKAEQDRERAEAQEQKRRMEESEKLTKDFDEQITFVLKALDMAASELNNTSKNMVDQARKNENQSSSAAEASVHTDANVKSVAAASEELSASIKEIHRQVARSIEITRKADQRANEAAEVVDSLSAASDKVGQIVELIDAIANQTNMLALNATIESARAGDAGKGFAVVAQEVKALADQTSNATDEISLQVDTIQSISSDLATSVQAIKDVMGETSSISAEVASAIEQQSAATAEIARNAQEAQASTQEVSDRLQDVRNVAEFTRESSSTVSHSAVDLSSQTVTLKEQFGSYVEGIKRVNNGESVENHAQRHQPAPTRSRAPNLAVV